MSESTAKSLPSLIRPMAIPATGAFSGTPASIIDSEEPHTDAIDEEPLDSVISDTQRNVYGNSSMLGLTASTPRLASRQWPISRHLGPIIGRVTPVKYGGKLSWKMTCYFYSAVMA